MSCYLQHGALLKGVHIQFHIWLNMYVFLCIVLCFIVKGRYAVARVTEQKLIQAGKPGASTGFITLPR